MRKNIIIAVLSIIVSILLIVIVIWLYPIKKSISPDKISYIKYDKSMQVAILCTGGQETGPLWKVINSDEKTHFVDIVGNTPDKSVKSKLYNYLNNIFLFIGNYSEHNSEVFIVGKWYIVGDINRRHMLLPYPKRYLNIFEIKIPHE